MEISCAFCGQSIPPRVRTCNSVGPCSRHRTLHVSEINSHQGRSAKQNVIFMDKIPHMFFGICNFFCVDTALSDFVL